MTAPRLVDGTRNQRYTEVLLGYFHPGGVKLEVYNSYMLGESPQELWEALSSETIAKEFGADFALLNGPRYWLMDGIKKVDAQAPVVVDFGGIPMRLAATILRDGPMERHHFEPVTVNRSAAFCFNAGEEVFELVDPEGRRFVMQAYCTAVDATLRYEDLPGLGSRIHPPAGWRYERRVLTEELTVDTTDRPAEVLQDEFENSYCLEG